MTHAISRRHFLTTTAVGAVLLGQAPAALGQQVREIQVWHTEVEPQTVKTIQDTSIAEFERKFLGFKVRQQALGWGDLNTKLLASLAAGSPPDLTHLNPFMTASLYTKKLLRPMDELIRALGESDIHEATRKLQYFDGKAAMVSNPASRLLRGSHPPPRLHGGCRRLLRHPSRVVREQDARAAPAALLAHVEHWGVSAQQD